MKCVHCAAANSNEALFCFACGRSLRSNDEVECENHTGTIATGVCAVCRKPVCDDCSVTFESKVYCEGSHSRLVKTHVMIAASPTEFEAEIVSAQLTANGVHALAFSSKKYSMLSCLTDDTSCAIFVPVETRVDAERLIDEADLNEFLSRPDTRP